MDLVGFENQGMVNSDGQRSNVDYLWARSDYETNLSLVAKKQHFSKHFLAFFWSFYLTFIRF